MLKDYVIFPLKNLNFSVIFYLVIVSIFCFSFDLQVVVELDDFMKGGEDVSEEVERLRKEINELEILKQTLQGQLADVTRQ